MSQLEAYHGIFIQSNETSEDFINACISELQPVCNSRIKRVVTNNTGTGIQMYFEDKKTVISFLSRRVLVVSGKSYNISPLVTHLTIHKVIPIIAQKNIHIQKKLSDNLQRYIGPVLRITELPASKKYTGVDKADWRVIIDIPELEALRVFQNLKKKSQNSPKGTSTEFFYLEDGMKLTFFCSKCEKDGHISQHCKMLEPTVKKPSAQNIHSNTYFHKDVVASTSTAASNNTRGQTSRETIGQPREECSTSIGRLSIRKSEDVQNTLRAPSFSQRVIIPPTRNIHSSATVKNELCNPRRNSAIGQIRILSNSRIEECIQKAGSPCRLSQPQLENFFNHVKGKKDIRRILKMYKKMHKISEKALEEQLNEIVRLYYVSKLPETKEDKSLIRWLECLVERLNKKLRKVKKKRWPAKSRKEKPKDNIFTDT